MNAFTHKVFLWLEQAAGLPFFPEGSYCSMGESRVEMGKRVGSGKIWGRATQNLEGKEDKRQRVLLPFVLKNWPYVHLLFWPSGESF